MAITKNSMSSKSKTSTKSSSSTKGNISYSSIVKAQGGVATNPQTGAKTYSKSSAPKGGGNFAVRGDNAELLQDVDPTKASSKGGIPNFGGLTPTPQPITPEVSPALQPPAPVAGAVTGQEALKNAQATGQAPQDPGEARRTVQNFMPAASSSFYKIPNDTNPSQVYNAKGEALNYDQYIAQGGKADFSNVQQGLPDTSVIDQQLAQDPNFTKILQDQKEYTDVLNQQKSLTDTYTQLTKQLGIKSLDTQLMNMKNVIDGTEDDIRNEVTKAGGFATESQVLALSSSRNKQLIQNYNNLLNVKQQAQDTLNTMIGLAEKDKSLALQSITQKLNIDSQIYEFSQRANENAKNSYQQIINKVGYEGLNAMTGGNAFYQAMIEKTLGMPAGGLAKASVPETGPVKFETRTIGSGKGSYPVRFGYDAAGNIISRVNLATGQEMGGGGSSFSSGATPQATTPRITPRGNPAPKPSTSSIKAIIAANPNEWGNAADAIDRKYGADTATKYDKELKAAYAKKASSPSTAKPSLFDSL